MTTLCTASCRNASQRPAPRAPWRKSSAMARPSPRRAMAPTARVGSARGTLVPRRTAPGEQASPEPESSPAREGAWDWEYLTGSLGPTLMRAGMARYGLSRQDAEDLLQDIYQRVLVKRPVVRSAEAYVRTSFYHASIDLLRSRRRATSVQATTLLADDPIPRLVAAIAVRSALGNISATCRSLIEAYCLQERSLAETAAGLGGSVNAVWKRIDRCLNRLLQTLR